MGVLIVVGTVTLVVLIVQRAGGAMGGAMGGGSGRLALSLDQPPGTRIAGIAPVEAAGGGGLAVWVRRPDGTEAILLVDARRGRLAGEIQPTAVGPATR